MARRERFERNCDSVRRAVVTLPGVAAFPAPRALQQASHGCSISYRPAQIELDSPVGESALDLASVETEFKYEGYLRRADGLDRASEEAGRPDDPAAVSIRRGCQDSRGRWFNGWMRSVPRRSARRRGSPASLLPPSRLLPPISIGSKPDRLVFVAPVALRTRLTRRASKAGVFLPDDLAAKLVVYYELLERWNRKINLTSLEDLDQAIDRLLLEPVIAARHLPAGTEPLDIMDVGSGGGSPALPLALAGGARAIADDGGSEGPKIGVLPRSGPTAGSVVSAGRKRAIRRASCPAESSRAIRRRCRFAQSEWSRGC